MPYESRCGYCWASSFVTRPLSLFSSDGEDLDALLARADERLRVSKEEKPGLSRSAF